MTSAEHRDGPCGPLAVHRKVASKTASKMPPWTRTLLSAPPDYTPTFNEIRDCYTYLRSIRALHERSEIALLSAETLDLLDHVMSPEGFACLLDVKSLIHSLINALVGPQVPRAKRAALFGVAEQETKLDGYSQYRLDSFLTDSRKNAQCADWKWRIRAACQELVVEQGWYPLFGTYTVDPKILPQLGLLNRDELWLKTPAWDRFIKRFKTEIADVCGYGRKPAKWPKGMEFFQYFGVLEHGASGDHPHVHVLFLCKDLPLDWKKDPNRACVTETETDIPGASALWIHGVQRVTAAVRMHGGPFESSGLNWVIPMKEVNGVLVRQKVGDPGAVAGYISKYMAKPESKKWKHRVKATRGIGLKTLFRIIKEAPLSIIKALAYRPMEYGVAMKMSQMTSCPLSLLRQKSKMELERRWHTSSEQSDAELLQAHWTRKPLAFFTLLTNRVKDGLSIWSETPCARYKLYTRILPAVSSTVHSDEIMEKLKVFLDNFSPPVVKTINGSELRCPSG